MNFLFFTIIALVIGIIADLISKNGFVAIVAAMAEGSFKEPSAQSLAQKITFTERL